MAEEKGFDLASYLKAVPKMDTGQERIEYIDIARLGDDPKNFYSLSDLDGLAENIELVGLQQPLRVRPNPDYPGYYIIVSGHRRRAAIRMLVEDGRDNLRAIPCIVDATQESAAMQELRLIFANSSTRKLTSAELADQADRVTALLYQLKEEGVEFPGRMRDHVAQAVQTSKSKLARLKVIKDHLEPTLLDKWQAGDLDEAPAYELARMPAALQQRISKFKQLPSANTLAAIRVQAENGATWAPTLICPDGKTCTHADTFVLVAGKHPSRNCDGSKCCLECQDGAKCDYYCCDRMCARAKTARKARKDEATAKADQKEQARTAKAQRLTVSNARRILRAAEAAGLSDATSIPWEWFGQITVKNLRRWAEGDFAKGWHRYFAEPQLSPKSLRLALDAAKVLKCSADYLLGVTDDLHPTAPAPSEYITGRDPAAPVSAVALFARGGGLPPLLKIADWTGERWTFPHGAVIEAPCVGWYPIPKTPEVGK